MSYKSHFMLKIVHQLCDHPLFTTNRSLFLLIISAQTVNPFRGNYLILILDLCQIIWNKSSWDKVKPIFNHNFGTGNTSMHKCNNLCAYKMWNGWSVDSEVESLMLIFRQPVNQYRSNIWVNCNGLCIDSNIKFSQ